LRRQISNFKISEEGENAMSEQNKAVVRRLFEELWNKGNLMVADELLAPNYVNHDPSTPDFGRGPENEKKRASLYRSAFPDLRMTIEDMIAEGDMVTARWSCRATHKGDLGGIAPTGKQVTTSGISIGRFAAGKIAEAWVNWDALGFMQQLGVMPDLGKAKRAAR
jgi:ketosteroid isomerase-like protein